MAREQNLNLLNRIIWISVRSKIIKANYAVAMTRRSDLLRNFAIGAARS